MKSSDLNNGATLMLAAQFPHPGDWYLTNIMAKFNGKWVTWVFNETDGGCHSGHYFDNQSDAMTDFSNRVEKVANAHDEQLREARQDEQAFLAAMASVYPEAVA
jgi:hypothetical protein